MNLELDAKIRRAHARKYTTIMDDYQPTLPSWITILKASRHAPNGVLASWKRLGLALCILSAGMVGGLVILWSLL
jgi:hypothetical protein